MEGRWRWEGGDAVGMKGGGRRKGGRKTAEKRSNIYSVIGIKANKRC